MSITDSVQSQLYQHVFGTESPHSSVLDNGVLSDEWTTTYLQLLKDVNQRFGGQDSLPRDIIAAVHFASWYLNIRYDSWKHFNVGMRNEKTEHNLARLRTPSEMLLLSGYYNKRKLQRDVSDSSN
jgi:hypothetical protein